APQLEEIRKRLPAKRQTLLFSATIPSDIQTMGSRYLKEPVRITIGTTTQPVTKIAQMVIHTMESKKPDELVGELNERQGSILIFARTQNRVDRIAERLKDQGLKVTRIHGGRSQSQRRQAIEQFRQGNYRILVATDIAARGLDIHHIAHVINYDLPRNPEDYIHRVGRTARAGAEGSSLCFLTPEDRDLWNRILRLIGAPKDSIQVKASRFGNMTPKTSGPSHDSHRPAPRHEGGQRHERQGFKPRDSHSRSKPAHSHTPRHDSRPAPRPAPRSFSGGGSFSGGQEGRPRENQGFAPRRPFDKPQGRPFSPTRSEHGRPPQGRSFDKPRDGFQARPPESTSHPTRTPWDKLDQHGFRKEGGFQKRRHPDGRHQKRSDMHFGRTPSGPDHERGNQNIFHGADKKTPSNQPPHPDEDKQPADNRSSWEKKPYDGTQS